MLWSFRFLAVNVALLLLIGAAYYATSASDYDRGRWTCVSAKEAADVYGAAFVSFLMVSRG